jgi:hypothetical protein
VNIILIINILIEMNASKYLMVAAMLAAQNGDNEVKAVEIK